MDKKIIYLSGYFHENNNKNVKNVFFPFNLNLKTIKKNYITFVNPHNIIDNLTLKIYSKSYNHKPREKKVIINN